MTYSTAFKIFFAAAFACLSLSGLKAQTVEDAYRYSQTSPTGSARSLGMGGASSAVGADVTSMALNPAGLGLYRRSNLQISGALQMANTNADFFGEKNSASLTNFGLTSGGGVFNIRLPGAKRLNNIVIGVGVNQLQNFYRQSDFTAINPHNSVSTYLANYAASYGSSAFDFIHNLTGQPEFYPDQIDQMAIYTGWNAGAIPGVNSPISIIENRVDANNQYITDQYFGAFNGGKIQQRQTWTEKGRNNQWNFSLAANIDNKFYFGMGIGITDMRYSSDRLIVEKDVNHVYEANTADTMAVDEIQFGEKITTSGTGVNFNIGVIYQPIDLVRFGISVVTPTFNSMSDQFSNSLSIKADQLASPFSQSTVVATYDYSLTTPYRLNIGGVLFIPNKIGMVSADFELTDYSKANFKTRVAGDNTSFSNRNSVISQAYSLGYNFRVGAELRYKILYVRAGYGFYKSGIKPEYAPNGFGMDRHAITGGLGVRGKRLTFDVAYVHNIVPDYTVLYGVNNNLPYATMTKTLSNVVFTLGFNFGKTEDE